MILVYSQSNITEHDIDLKMLKQLIIEVKDNSDHS